MLTLKYNPASERFDCYENGKCVATLTCGTRFNLYCDDEDVLVAGRIEYHSTHRYYFICHDEYVMYLYNGLQGTLS
ncbi:Uncharacterised protein [Turicibacter sanguinis]|nr:Uncharacterised protein [Turicibacter sanguinis]